MAWATVFIWPWTLPWWWTCSRAKKTAPATSQCGTRYAMHGYCKQEQTLFWCPPCKAIMIATSAGPFVTSLVINFFENVRFMMPRCQQCQPMNTTSFCFPVWLRSTLSNRQPGICGHVVSCSCIFSARRAFGIANKKSKIIWILCIISKQHNITIKHCKK